MEERGDILESLDFVEYVLEKWQIKVRFQELKNQVGKNMTDPIADMLNRIRNAQAVNHITVKVPYSKAKNSIAKILKEKGFINDFSVKQKKQEKLLDIVLKYINGEPMVSGMKKISKPGQRIYTPVSKIQRVRGGYGIMIVSTSQGIMTGQEARKNNTGGEIICKVW